MLARLARPECRRYAARSGEIWTRIPDVRYAVVLMRDGMVTRIAQKYLTLRSSAAYVRAYARLSRGTESTAAVVPHPISRAISVARPRSRSA